MEIRSSLRNRDILSPESNFDNRITGGVQLCSPKFTRKRGEGSNIFIRKAEKTLEAPEHITYISPKKYLQHQHSATDSVKSINSISSFNRVDKFKKQQISAHQRACLEVPSYSSNISLNSMQSLASVNSIGDLSVCNLNGNLNGKNKDTRDIRVFETAQQIRSKVRANQQVAQLKASNQNLNRRVNQLNDKIKCMRQQNGYLYKKIENFNEVIAQKNQIINQFSHFLKDKQQAILVYEQDINELKKSNQQLQNIITLLKQSNSEQCYQKCSCTNTTKDTEDPPSLTLIQETQNKYKFQIEELSSKVKYFEIQSSMYQKLRYDLNAQIQKNEVLKGQNRKLIARIQFLVDRENAGRQNTLKSNNNGRIGNPCVKGRQNGILGNRVSRRQSQISFQLSPEK